MKNIITIGREYGSGGYEIGEKLAKRLGYKLYDKELIATIAEKTLLSETYVESKDENVLTTPHHKNIFRELSPIFVNDDEEQTRYIFDAQGRFIVNLAKEGRCIIIGRRADYYLKDNEAALHLYFYADKEFKAERISRLHNCTIEEAYKKCADMDRRRKTSYEYTTGRAWADIHNYDRIICTSSFGIDACVDEIAGLIEGQKK